AERIVGACGTLVGNIRHIRWVANLYRRTATPAVACQPRHGGRSGRLVPCWEMALLDRETIVRALERLDERLGAKGVRAELFLVGGPMMGLVPPASPATKDSNRSVSEPGR